MLCIYVKPSSFTFTFLSKVIDISLWYADEQVGSVSGKQLTPTQALERVRTFSGYSGAE